MLRPLILASSSPYRRALLQQLQLSFISDSPHINEERHPGERPADLAQRLAAEKARALGPRHRSSLIIGSDQVAECGDSILGKPGTRENAIRQLLECSGRQVNFHTGISVLDTSSGEQITEVEVFTVTFRSLDETEIHYYVDTDRPFDCAGSFKAEGLGIALFEKMEGSDFNSLVGLPLIRLINLLKQFGLDPLRPQGTPNGSS